MTQLKSTVRQRAVSKSVRRDYSSEIHNKDSQRLLVVRRFMVIKLIIGLASVNKIEAVRMTRGR